jgi:transcription elongation factor Elf1
MADSIFEEGGPHRIKHTGNDHFTMNISMPNDEDGMIGRECSSTDCQPAYFKVKPGTGLKDQKDAYCPYCSHKDDQQSFCTSEQKNYATNVVEREALKGIDKILRKGLGLDSTGERKVGGGLFSLTLSLKTPIPPAIPRPIEEELRRNLTCPYCNLEHAVFGLAIWCPDCGADIFLTHVNEEFNVIRKMMDDVDSRRQRLGPRIAAKDIENALEDIVSTFEATLRIITKLYLRKSGMDQLEIDEIIKTRVANKFQNIELGAVVFQDILGYQLLESLTPDECNWLKVTFEKRHPITHNLGIIDRKYLEKVRTGESQGREVRIQTPEILGAIELCLRCINSVYPKLSV